MTRTPICIPATLPLNLAVDDYFLTNHHVAFPVTSDDGEFRGLLRLEFLQGVPREKWPYVTAGDLAAEKQTQELSLEAHTSAARAMRLLLAPGLGRLAVTENGRTVGIITRHDILHFVKIHTELA
jgi:CBS domain-containing protein